MIKDHERLQKLGSDKLRGPIINLINIAYSIFINSNGSGRSLNLKDNDFNFYINGVLIKQTPTFVFVDDVTGKLYLMELSHVSVIKMVPHNNYNVLQQYNYEIYGDVRLELLEETKIDNDLFNWYKNKRHEFTKIMNVSAPRATAINKFGELEEVNFEIAEDITKEDYCAFDTIIQSIPIIQEFILLSLSFGSMYKLMSDNGFTEYFSQSEIVWASMLVNDSINRIVDGFHSFDKITKECRITSVKAYIDFHTRKLTEDELKKYYIKDDKLVAIDHEDLPSVKCLNVGVFTVSDNTTQ